MSGTWTANLSDVLRGMMQLLPRGPVWSRELARRANLLLAGLAEEHVRYRLRANELLDEAYPPTSSELLPEWRRVFGLPEFTYFPTVEADQQAEVEAKMLSAPGGQSAVYFAALAVRLGCAGAAVADGPGEFQWTLTLPSDCTRACCTSSCDAALVEFTTADGRRTAQAATAYKPAHTHIFFDGGIAP